MEIGMRESDAAAGQAEIPKSGSPEGKGKSQYSTKTLRAAVAPLLGSLTTPPSSRAEK
jgi:hypothetical protein